MIDTLWDLVLVNVTFLIVVKLINTNDDDNNYYSKNVNC